MDAKCTNCGEPFVYDEDAGLNMKRFEPKVDNRSIFIGGVCPACPKCDARYQPPRTEIQFKKVWMCSECGGTVAHKPDCAVVVEVDGGLRQYLPRDVQEAYALRAAVDRVTEGK